MRKKIFIVCIVIVCLLMVSGCVDTSNEDDNGDYEFETNISFLDFKIGDKPTDDFAHVNVTFSEVKLYSNETEWVDIPLNTTTVDLIYLHMNNLSESLGVGELEENNYSKLWIVVDTVIGVLNSTWETVTIDVPSNTLKIQHLFDIREGNNTIVVEIDLDSSIKVIGQGKAYKIVPVIGALRVRHQDGVEQHIRDREQLNNKIENRPPSIDLVVNGSRGKPIDTVVNESIIFNASETFDIEEDDITYHWDFDDGINSTGEIVIHSYSESGSYWVTLTVSDGELESTEQIHITVKKSHGQGNN